MVKLTTPKRNIIEHLRAKSLPSFARDNERAKKPLNKGLYLGSCNRRDCLKPGANYYNHSTQRYYCEDCANWLNEDTFNKKDSMEMYGHDLCTYGRYDHQKYSDFHYFNHAFEQAMKVFRKEFSPGCIEHLITINLKDIEAVLQYKINTKTNKISYSNSHIAKKELSFVYEYDFVKGELDEVKERAYSSYKSLQRLFETVVK